MICCAVRVEEVAKLEGLLAFRLASILTSYHPHPRTVLFFHSNKGLTTENSRERCFSMSLFDSFFQELEMRAPAANIRKSVMSFRRFVVFANHKRKP